MNEIVSEPRDQAVFKYLLQTLNQFNIAYVHTGAFDDSLTFPALDHKTMTAFMRQYYHGTLITSGGYNFDTVDQGVQEGDFDLVALGRPFIANPDLITRLQKRGALQDYQPEMLQNIF
jgi:2,4-dienoyl-CoA reductase-like NADH-dependent reductase (Old Yellow Enzyme family)